MVPNACQYYQLTGVVVPCYNPTVYEKNAMPRNALSWKEQAKRLKDARALAAFLDLQPDGGIKFRKEYSGFLPLLMWQVDGPMPNGELGRYPLWLQMQSQLRKVWRKGFPEKDVLDLISANSTLLDFAAENSPVSESGSLDRYRKAILFLYGDSWRAKDPCPECGRHFIANHSQQQCCSVPCSVEWRQQYKAKRHEQVKEELNARRRQEYAAKKKNKKKTTR